MAAPPAMDPIIAKLKRHILRRGGDNAIRGVSRCFKIMDDDGDNSLSPEEFRAGLDSLGLKVSDADAVQLVKAFDRNRDGSIQLQEFLTALRVGMPPKRRAYVQRVFKLFDTNSDGRLTVDELHGRYNAAGHPLVLQGERTAEEQEADFLASFDSKTNPDGVISKQEFEQYYAGVSAAIDNDTYFIELLRRTWNLPSEKSATKLDSTTGTEVPRASASAFTGLDDSLRTIRPTTFRLDEKEASIQRDLCQDKATRAVRHIEKLCLRLVPTQFLGLGREFRRRDKRRIGFVETEEVDDVLRACKLHFHVPPDMVAALKREYDCDHDGTFDYLAMMNAVTGELPPERKILLERTWKKFKTDKRGYVTVDALHANYIPDYTPDVAKGLRTRGEQLSSFLDTWDARSVPSQKVSFEAFEEYYVPISREMACSRHFDTMIKVSWAVWREEGARLLAALTL